MDQKIEVRRGGVLGRTWGVYVDGKLVEGGFFNRAYAVEAASTLRAEEQARAAAGKPPLVAPAEISSRSLIVGNAARARRFGGWDSVRIDGVFPLPWARSLELRYHSPTGFTWGYMGSGPAQLALAILLALTTEAEALRWYQEFKASFLAATSIEKDLVISVADVLGWLERVRAKGGVA